MLRFRFKLDPLLRARCRCEQERQLVVARLETQRRELEAAIRRCQESIERGRRELRGRLVGRVDMTALSAHAGSTMQSVRRAHSVMVKLAGVHEQLVKARGALAEAARDRRAIELLRERSFENWKRDLNRKEDAAIDELASRAAFRKER